MATNNNINNASKYTVFTSSGTFYIDPRTQSIAIFGSGGGGGGGSGRKGSSGFASGGAGGTGASAILNVILPAFAFNPAGETVTIGAGGVGGAAQTSVATDGNAGGAQTASSIGNISTGASASASAGGTTTSASPGGSAANFSYFRNANLGGRLGGIGQLANGSGGTNNGRPIFDGNGGGGGAGANSSTPRNGAGGDH